jgi:acyl dehydratase
MDDRRHLEDFEAGQRFASSDEYLMATDRMIAYATDYDPQPIHIDAEAAADELFGGLVASGWQTLGATTRLVLAARPLGSTPLVGVGIDNLRFLAPVRAGDVLTAEAEVLEVRPSRSHPERGYLVLRVTTRRRQDGEAVLTQDWTLLLPRTPTAARS